MSSGAPRDITAKSMSRTRPSMAILDLSKSLREFEALLRLCFQRLDAEDDMREHLLSVD